MDNCQSFCPYSKKYIRINNEKSFNSVMDSKFFPPDPYGLQRDDIGRHVRQGRLLFHPLFFSSEATFDMAFR